MLDLSSTRESEQFPRFFFWSIEIHHPKGADAQYPLSDKIIKTKSILYYKG